MTGLSTGERIVAEELDHGCCDKTIVGCTDDVGGEFGGKEDRTGFVAVVAFVAHVQRFGQQGAHVEAVAQLERVVPEWVPSRRSSSAVS